MNPVEYKYKNFLIEVHKYQGTVYVNITCTLEGESLKRVYELDHDITSIVMDEEYVYLNYNDSGLTGYDNDSQYVIKFEGNNGVVIDRFDNRGEHLEDVGCHDFWDDKSFF